MSDPSVTRDAIIEFVQLAMARRRRAVSAETKVRMQAIEDDLREWVDGARPAPKRLENPSAAPVPKTDVAPAKIELTPTTQAPISQAPMSLDSLAAAIPMSAGDADKTNTISLTPVASAYTPPRVPAFMQDYYSESLVPAEITAEERPQRVVTVEGDNGDLSREARALFGIGLKAEPSNGPRTTVDRPSVNAGPSVSPVIRPASPPAHPVRPIARTDIPIPASPARAASSGATAPPPVPSDPTREAQGPAAKVRPSRRRPSRLPATDEVTTDPGRPRAPARRPTAAPAAAWTHDLEAPAPGAAPSASTGQAATAHPPTASSAAHPATTASGGAHPAAASAGAHPASTTASSSSGVARSGPSPAAAHRTPPHAGRPPEQVIVYGLDGKSTRGLLPQFDPSSGVLEVLVNAKPPSQNLALDQVMAIFFRVQPGAPPTPQNGTSVVVRLVNDREVMGVTPDYEAGAMALTVIPEPRHGNVDRVWIPAWAVKAIEMDDAP